MNTTTNSKLKKIVLTALFAALSCVATMSIKLPTPGTGGYIHPGDAMVILSGVVLDHGGDFLQAELVLQWQISLADISCMFRSLLRSKDW